MRQALTVYWKWKSEPSLIVLGGTEQLWIYRRHWQSGGRGRNWATYRGLDAYSG